MQTAAVRVETRGVGLRQFLWAGPIAGLAVVVVARAWMRWITVDPEFSWSGTIGIVVVFVVSSVHRLGLGSRVFAFGLLVGSQGCGLSPGCCRSVCSVLPVP